MPTWWMPSADTPGSCHGARRAAAAMASCRRTSTTGEARMGLFDKVKEKASDALEQGKEAAQTQQLKLQLRKLEGEVEAASAALGAAAFDLLEAGTLSASHTLDALATRVREARAAVEGKKAEIKSAGDDSSDSSAPSAPSEG